VVEASLKAPGVLITNVSIKELNKTPTNGEAEFTATVELTEAYYSRTDTGDYLAAQGADPCTFARIKGILNDKDAMEILKISGLEGTVDDLDVNKLTLLSQTAPAGHTYDARGKVRATRQDQAWQFRVSESVLGQAKPTGQPRSKYGNQALVIDLDTNKIVEIITNAENVARRLEEAWGEYYHANALLSAALKQPPSGVIEPKTRFEGFMCLREGGGLVKVRLRLDGVPSSSGAKSDVDCTMELSDCDGVRRVLRGTLINRNILQLVTTDGKPSSAASSTRPLSFFSGGLYKATLALTQSGLAGGVGGTGWMLLLQPS
jgi:hypothetical protein